VSSNEVKNHKINDVVTEYVLPVAPPLPDATYTHKESLKWSGGESKFGPWRQYANTYEKGWLLTYNTPFNTSNNSFDGRDSGNSLANICLALQFNVAEGNSGTNSMGLLFSPPGLVGTPPDFVGGAQYHFFDGKLSLPTIPARFRVTGAGSVQAVLQLKANATISPSDWAFISDIDNTVKVQRSYESSPFTVLSWDASGNFNTIGQLRSTVADGTPPLQVTSKTKVINLTSERVEILTTANLPAAGSSQDGRIIIEDAGVNSANLVIYKGGQRFRASVWTSF